MGVKFAVQAAAIPHANGNGKRLKAGTVAVLAVTNTVGAITAIERNGEIFRIGLFKISPELSLGPRRQADRPVTNYGFDLFGTETPTRIPCQTSFSPTAKILQGTPPLRL